MQVKTDAQAGHITLHDGEQAGVAFVDLGPVLHLWQYQGGIELDPEAAQALGAALTAWGQRKAGDDA